MFFGEEEKSRKILDPAASGYLQLRTIDGPYRSHVVATWDRPIPGDDVGFGRRRGALVQGGRIPLALLGKSTATSVTSVTTTRRGLCGECNHQQNVDRLNISTSSSTTRNESKLPDITPTRCQQVQKEATQVLDLKRVPVQPFFLPCQLRTKESHCCFSRLS